MTIVIAAIGYGGSEIYETVRERQITAEKKKQDEVDAWNAAREAKLGRIADKKREQIRNADRETLRKRIISCQEQLNT